MPDMLQSRWLLAVDPGSEYGAALFDGCDLVSVLHGDHSIASVARVLSAATSRAGAGELGLVVENQFSGRPGARFNPKSLDVLTKCRHTWELLAEIRGISWDRVYPASWQVLLAAVPRRYKTKARDTKARTLTFAARRWPHLADLFGASQDACDAAVIGLWYAQERLKWQTTAT